MAVIDEQPYAEAPANAPISNWRKRTLTLSPT
jgi:hypothetical protein